MFKNFKENNHPENIKPESGSLFLVAIKLLLLVCRNCTLAVGHFSSFLQHLKFGRCS